MARLFEHVDKDNDTTVKRGGDILYLVLLEYCPKDGNSENRRDWKFIKGRQDTYDYIRDILLSEEDESVEDILDIDASLIYADNPHIPIEANKLRLSNGISIYKFMKDCYVLQKVQDEGGFDIDEFKTNEVEE